MCVCVCVCTNIHIANNKYAEAIKGRYAAQKETAGNHTSPHATTKNDATTPIQTSLPSIPKACCAHVTSDQSKESKQAQNGREKEAKNELEKKAPNGLENARHLSSVVVVEVDWVCVHVSTELAADLVKVARRGTRNLRRGTRNLRRGTRNLRIEGRAICV